MPIGVYKRSPEQIKRLKDMAFKKGHKPYKTAFKKGMIPWNKGKKLPQITGANHPGWKNGIHYKYGYIMLYRPSHPFCNKGGYVREHRLIIEKQIGRYLLPSEKCHHLGAKDDNRPNMLMAFINHSAHMIFEYGGNIRPQEIIFDGRNIS